MEEPYRLTVEQIANLTDAQIAHVYARPRDDKGRPKPVGVAEKRKYTTPEEARTTFMGLATTLGGLTTEQAEDVWRRKTGRA